MNDLASAPALVETRYGRMALAADPSDLIGRFLRTYGEWAPYEVRFVAGALHDGARVADVGAFLGTFGLGLMRARPLGRVCFVEANARTVPLLRDNVARNASAPCEVVAAALVPSSFDGASATVLDGNAGSFSLAEGAADDRCAADLVADTLTLRALLDRHGPFDLIKLDVEGLEDAILRDDPDLLSAAPLWVECNEAPGALTLCQMLLDAGLEVNYAAFPVIGPDNYAASPERIFPWAYESGLWASRGAPPPMDRALADAGCVLRRIHDAADLKRALWDTPRWSPPDWSDVPTPVIVARASRSLLSGGFAEFLDAAAPPALWSEPAPARLQREAAETHAAAHAAAIMLHAERAWMARQCAEMDAERAAAAAERDRLQRGLTEAQAARAAAEARLDVIARSNAFRAVGTLTRLAEANPKLYGLARAAARRAVRLARRAP